MNKHKKKSWIIVAISIPICLMLIVGGIISIVHFKAAYLAILPMSGIMFTTYAMFKVSKSESLSDRHDMMILNRKAFCKESGYLFVEEKKSWERL